MPSRRFVAASWLASGVLLFWAAPVATLWVYQLALSRPANNPAVTAALSLAMPLLPMGGLVLVGIGAHRLRSATRTVVIVLLTAQLAVTLHYLLWKAGAITEFGGAAAIWMIVLIPLLTASLVALIRSVRTREDRALTTAGLFVWVGQACTAVYLYWIVSGI